MGLDVIEELIKSEAETLVSTGRPPWSRKQEKALKSALEAALFGLGRLQPLVEREDVENIIVIARGPDCSVWLELSTAPWSRPPRSPTPRTSCASSSPTSAPGRTGPSPRPGRTWTCACPGGARLAAGSWVMANTSVVIRRHGMREVSMDEMVYDRKACGAVLADFLAACVRAGKSIVVSGVQGSGKTTWVRALCSCIPPWEMIGTFETEFELHLHELVDRHKIVHAWEHRPGSGEVGIDGRQAGEFSLEEAIHHSFRFNLARQIVGEVRGPEVWNMLKAMESGPGSISTTHARSAEHTIEKLVSCAMEKGPQVTRELAISKLAAAIDIVMYLRSEVVRQRRRHLPQAALGRGGPGRPAEHRRGQGVRDHPDLRPQPARPGRRDRQARQLPRPGAGPPRVRPRGVQGRVPGQPGGGDHMTPLLPAVFGALIVIGLIGMVYALIPAPPKPPRPARTVTPFGRAGQPVHPAQPAHPDADHRRRCRRPPGRAADRLGDRDRARPGRDRRHPAAAHAPAGGREHREARGARGVDPVAVGQADRRPVAALGSHQVAAVGAGARSSARSA